ncbi:hypothetical protein GGF31_007001 [Allomyces arbusculus]|nr:hypothetical protein GGF31_007001 [Allomyces arbusculus]
MPPEPPPANGDPATGTPSSSSPTRSSARSTSRSPTRARHGSSLPAEPQTEPRTRPLPLPPTAAVLHDAAAAGLSHGHALSPTLLGSEDQAVATGVHRGPLSPVSPLDKDAPGATGGYRRKPAKGSDAGSTTAGASHASIAPSNRSSLDSARDASLVAGPVEPHIDVTVPSTSPLTKYLNTYLPADISTAPPVPPLPPHVMVSPTPGSTALDPATLLRPPHPSLVAVHRTPSVGARNKPTALRRKPSSRHPGMLVAGSPLAPAPPGAGSATVAPATTPVPGATAADELAAIGGAPGKWWPLLARFMTFWAPTFILKRTISKDLNTILAWREKMALCTVIALVGAIVAFFTLGLQPTLCQSVDRSAFTPDDIALFNPIDEPNAWIIRGEVYDLTPYLSTHMRYRAIAGLPSSAKLQLRTLSGVDATPLFPTAKDACAAVAQAPVSLPCSISQFSAVSYCHDSSSPLLAAMKVGQVRYPWSTLAAQHAATHVVWNGKVLDLSTYLSGKNWWLGADVHAEIIAHLGQDATLAWSRLARMEKAATCLAALYTVGFIDQDSPGCLASNIILIVGLLMILGVVMARFILAVAFDWFLSWKLGKLTVDRKAVEAKYKQPRRSIFRKSTGLAKALASAPDPALAVVAAAAMDPKSAEIDTSLPDALRAYYTVVLVTCYSEGADSLQKTLDSIAATDYSDPHKLLFVVADGLITGSGNDKSTPEIVLSLMDEVHVAPTLPQSYIAVADGRKRHNRARVHVGWYTRVDGHKVPMVVVVKCGTDAEVTKPGNRGKRDGQIIVMDFFSRLLLNDRLTPMQFDLFFKLYALTGVNPMAYEICLMVDADTKVLPDSLARMVACMAQDKSIMGLCGETRIENKAESWVTAIQVFEYYISHHLGKAFESIFGGVTCLPGCFCMYRIKVKRESDGFWVPILASPEIIASYSVNVVDTLHKKNLLALGEDRYLSTLMLRTFPKRKMMFVPQALCRTVVPHTLTMLLSQRRRWINSTIHNLLELVLVRQLCGTFCFSMQFVVFMELVGTVSLPVAIAMTIYLLVCTALGNVQVIPLAMLLCVLGLPAVLIVLTSRKLEYIFWMLIYLLALPVWNFLLPVYAFWHFDDFSWGETRKIAGDSNRGPKDDHGAKDGDFDGSAIAMRPLADWMRVLQAVPAPAGAAVPSHASMPPMPPVPTAAAGSKRGPSGARA